MESLRKISLQLALSLFAIFPASSSDIDYALDLIENGKVSSGIAKLEKLAFRGSEDASYSLGILYLAGKKFPTDLKKSYFWLRRGADDCHSKSIDILKTYFYEKRGSLYFDPLKYKNTLRNCLRETEPQNRGREEEFLRETSRDPSNEKFLGQWKTRPLEKKYFDGSWISSGSGLAINKSGDFLTNEHVVDGCDFVLIQYHGYWASAEIGPVDKIKDLAIIRTGLPTPYFWMINGDPLPPGEEVFSVGFPFIFVDRNKRFSERNFSDPVEPVFSRGDVMSKSQNRYQDVVDIKSAAGASGSPVYDISASFRGVLTALATNTKQDGASTMDWSYLSSPSATIEFLNEFKIDYSENKSVRPLNATDLYQYGKKRAGFVLCGEY